MRFKLLLLFLPLQLLALPGFFEPWGKDADLKYSPPTHEQSQLSIPTRLMRQIIHFHQTVISPVDGPRSHFKPSSSSYMFEAMAKYGFLKGYIMGCDRLLRENDDPWVYKTAFIDGQRWKTDTP